MQHSEDALAITQEARPILPHRVGLSGARLRSHAGDDGGVQRVSSLHRILSSAAARGDEAAVVSAFAEALAIWDDLEVIGFVHDSQERLTVAVSLPGAEPPRGLLTLDDHLPAGAVPIRISATDAERLGLGADGDVLLARFGDDSTQPWLVAIAGSIGARDEARLFLYIDLLRESVARASALSAARLTSSMFRHLVGGASVEAAAAGALAALTSAIGACDAALTVAASDGRRLLEVGPSFRTDDHLLTSRRTAGGCTLTIRVRRGGGETFTRREQFFSDTAAGVFADWIPGALRAASHGGDRRGPSRLFEDVIEQIADRSAHDGLDASVVVFALAEAVSAGALHEWVASIRAQLRASDAAGTVSAREIAVLLPGASRAEADRVALRLRRSLRADAAAIGIATRAAGSAPRDSVVHAARCAAARRACA